MIIVTGLMETGLYEAEMIKELASLNWQSLEVLKLIIVVIFYPITL